MNKKFIAGLMVGAFLALGGCGGGSLSSLTDTISPSQMKARQLATTSMPTLDFEAIANWAENEPSLKSALPSHQTTVISVDKTVATRTYPETGIFVRIKYPSRTIYVGAGNVETPVGNLSNFVCSVFASRCAGGASTAVILGATPANGETSVSPGATLVREFALGNATGATVAPNDYTLSCAGKDVSLTRSATSTPSQFVLTVKPNSTLPLGASCIDTVSLGVTSSSGTTTLLASNTFTVSGGQNVAIVAVLDQNAPVAAIDDAGKIRQFVETAGRCYVASSVAYDPRIGKIVVVCTVAPAGVHRYWTYDTKTDVMTNVTYFPTEGVTFPNGGAAIVYSPATKKMIFAEGRATSQTTATARLTVQRSDGNFATIPLAPTNGFINALRMDEADGSIWAATNLGLLMKFDPVTEKFADYSIINGVSIADFVVKSGKLTVVASNGTVATWDATNMANPVKGALTVGTMTNIKSVSYRGENLVFAGDKGVVEMTPENATTSLLFAANTTYPEVRVAASGAVWGATSSSTGDQLVKVNGTTSQPYPIVGGFNHFEVVAVY
jgi:hypothetical protein